MLHKHDTVRRRNNNNTNKRDSIIMFPRVQNEFGLKFNDVINFTMKYLKSFKMVNLIVLSLYFIVLFTTFKRIQIFYDSYENKYFYEKLKKCRKMSSLIIRSSKHNGSSCVHVILYFTHLIILNVQSWVNRQKCLLCNHNNNRIDYKHIQHVNVDFVRGST